VALQGSEKWTLREKKDIIILGENEEKLSVGLSREKDNMYCQLNTFLQERGF